MLSCLFIENEGRFKAHIAMQTSGQNLKVTQLSTLKLYAAD